MKSVRFNILVAAILSLGIAGCSSQGNQQIEHLTPTQVSQQITRGQTTQGQVKAYRNCLPLCGCCG